MKLSSERHSEETRRKISGSHFGITHTEETKQKMREAKLGKKYSELGREKLSEGVKRKIREGNLGVRRGEETKQKMREAKLGTKLTHEHKQKIRRSVLEIRVRDKTGERLTQGRVRSRFSGTRVYRSGSLACISYNGQRVWFPMVKLEIEAGLMYFYAGVILFKDSDCVDYFPPEEMPSEERQEELWRMVIEKLTEVDFLEV